jgi:hypothetical protein
MSEEKAAGDELTFYGLVNDLKKLRSAQERMQQLAELARVSPGLARNEHFQQIEVKTTMSLVSFDEVIREYERRNQEAERAERYNREMDERNRISAENREKPWLPFHDGE